MPLGLSTEYLSAVLFGFCIAPSTFQLSRAAVNFEFTVIPFGYCYTPYTFQLSSFDLTFISSLSVH